MASNTVVESTPAASRWDSEELADALRATGGANAHQAADHIEAQQREIDKLRAQLVIAKAARRAPSEFDPEAVNAFVTCAGNGWHSAASRGEQIANKLAKALAKIGDDFALLDGAVIDGAAEMMRQMSGPWPTADYKRLVFQFMRRAAR